VWVFLNVRFCCSNVIQNWDAKQLKGHVQIIGNRKRDFQAKGEGWRFDPALFIGHNPDLAELAIHRRRSPVHGYGKWRL